MDMNMKWHRKGTKRPAFRGAILAATVLAYGTIANSASDASEIDDAAPLEGRINLERFSLQEDVDMEHFVTAVDDNLFIGIAVEFQTGEQDDPQRLVVYLCDGEAISKWMVEDTPGLENTLAQGDARVELTIADGQVIGSVTLADEEPRSFLAEPATGDAGLFRAEWTLAGAHYMINWIVLADGSQRGSLDGKGNDVVIFSPP